MKLTIATSGGFGNIRIRGELDTGELDDALARKTMAALRPERLDALQREGVLPVPDATQFELSLFLDDGVRQYSVDEGHAPPDVAEVLHALVRELIQRRRRR